MFTLTRTFINHIKQLFILNGFDVKAGEDIGMDQIETKPDSTSEQGINFQCVFIAVKETTLLGGISKRRDFYFIHDIEADSFRLSGVSNAERASALHIKAKTFAASFYKMPKALRLGIPTVNTILISEYPFNSEMIELARKPTRTMVGGEFNQIFLLDINGKEMVSQGISRTWISGKPGHSIQKDMEFRNIDPQNRCFYLLNTFCNDFYKKNPGEHLCPVCRGAISPDPRYNGMICSSCIDRAVDYDGKPLEIYEPLIGSNGLTVRHRDTKEEIFLNTCMVDETECSIREAHFGGPVNRSIGR